MIADRGHDGGLLLNGKDAAKFLGISRTLFTELVNQGKIPFTVLGTEKRYRIIDLEELARPKSTIEQLMAPIVHAIREEYYGTNSVSFSGKKNRH